MYPFITCSILSANLSILRYNSGQLYLSSIPQFRSYNIRLFRICFNYLNLYIQLIQMEFKNPTTKFYLTKKQRLQAQKAFNIFDQDGSGEISIREFDQILKSIGQNLSQQELQQIVQSIDKDGNGFIDFEEFLEIVSPKIIMNRSQKSYVEAFKIIDENGDGVLDKDELKRANLITGAELSDDEIDAILKYVEVKFNGKFTFNQILKMLFRKPFGFHLN